MDRFRGCMIIIAAVLFTSAQSAIIKGMVTDSLTNVPVDSVLVQIKGTATSVYTNNQGAFVLDYSTAIKPVTAPVGKAETSGRVKVFDMNGRQVAENGSPDFGVVLSHLPAGVYAIRHAGKKGGTLEKIMLSGSNYPAGLSAGTTVQTAPAGGLAKMAGQTAALQFSRKFYAAREMSLTVPDTALVVKISRWFPDSNTTGVPAGTALTSHSGDLIIDASWVSAHGSIVDAMNISGSVFVQVSNITIKRSRINTTSPYWGIRASYNGVTGLLVQDCEVSGPASGKAPDGGIVAGDNCTVRRCNIHNCVDGIDAGKNTTIEYSYIHHVLRAAADHADAVQFEEVVGPGFATLTGNTLDYSVGAPGSSGGEVLMANGVYTDAGHAAGTPSLDLTLDGNFVNGGPYILYIQNRWHSVSVTNNMFGRSYQYGIIAMGNFGNENGGTLVWTWTNNSWKDTGVQISKP